MEIKFKEVLTKLMQERNVTAYQIALATGIKRPSIGYYLAGTASPAMNNLVKISKYFDVAIEELVYGEQLITREYIDQMVDSGAFELSNSFVCGDNNEFKVKRYVCGNNITIEMTLVGFEVHKIELFVTGDIVGNDSFCADILANKPTINNFLFLDRMFNYTPKA